MAIAPIGVQTVADKIKAIAVGGSRYFGPEDGTPRTVQTGAARLNMMTRYCKAKGPRFKTERFGPGTVVYRIA